jgi:hypothetical protein
MEEKKYLKILFLTFILSAFLMHASCYVNAQQQINVRAVQTNLSSVLSISPSSVDVLQGSTFDVSILLDSKKNSVNTIELNLKFPADKLEVVKPSKDKSIFGIWVAPPVYSNTEGTASFSGIIPNGITTSSGVVVTMTFKAKNTGPAVIKILPSSRILANDGMGTEMSVSFGNGNFTINPIPPDGPQVFSNTHPFQDKWYNNKNSTVNWGEGDDTLTQYSFILDDKPFTIPDDTFEGNERTKSFENLGDGLWYFHVKANKNKVWGATTHYLLRIDTTPPASFKPQLESLTAAIIGRNIVSFFTTDALSGIDHYEVGIIDKETPTTQSPVFVQTESPYQVPNIVSANLRIVVRAFDNAGNVRDEHVDTYNPLAFFKNNLTIIVILLTIIFLIFFVLFIKKYFAKFKRIAPQAPPPPPPPASLASFASLQSPPIVPMPPPPKAPLLIVPVPRRLYKNN